MERRGFLKGLLGIGVAAGAVAARKIEKKVDEVKKDVEVEKPLKKHPHIGKCPLPEGGYLNTEYIGYVNPTWTYTTTTSNNLSYYDNAYGYYINSNGILTRL